MKNSLLIGTVLGVVTATAIYSGMNQNRNSMRKAKKAFINKLEDAIL